MRYKSKNIEAIQWTGENLDEVKELLPANKIERSTHNNHLLIHTPRGFLIVKPDDFIIKLDEFEVQSIGSHVFNAHYQEV